jgi:hypothetical protein
MSAKMTFKEEYREFLENSIDFPLGAKKIESSELNFKFFVFKKLTDLLGVKLAQRTHLKSRMDLINMLVNEYDKENNCIPTSTLEKIFPDIIDYLI